MRSVSGMGCMRSLCWRHCCTATQQTPRVAPRKRSAVAAWSPLRKAVVDLFTSIFFFIFAGTLLATGWIFAMDATRVHEVSFSEWTIAYWPFKWAIVVGAVLLILQGIAKLARDIVAIRQSLQGA